MRNPAVLLCLIAVAAPAGAFPIAVRNPGGEDADPARPEMPLGYSTYASPGTTARFVWDRAAAHTGKASLSTLNEGPATGLWSPDPVPCVPGVEYRVSVWARTENAAGRTGVSVRFRGSEGWASPPLQQPDALAGTRDWTHLAFGVTPPEGATSLVIFLSNTEGKGGRVWFDDLTVEDNLDTLLLDQLPRILAKMAAAGALGGKSPALRRLDPAALREWRGRAGRLLDRVRPLAGKADVPAETRKELAGEWQEVSRFYRGVARDVGLAALLQEWAGASGQKDPPYLAGWQDAETRVWLRDQPIALRPARAERLLAAKGEVAAAQVVVAATGAALQKVRVSVGTPRGPAGALPANTVAVHPVGFVHLTRPAGLSEGYPHESEQAGWWPEILLDDFAFDVAAGDSQPVWLTIRVPRDAPAGTYAAPVTLAPANATPTTLTLQVEVADCSLPRAWAFKNILSFHDGWCRDFYGARWTPALRAKFLEFLLDRRINLASMYGETDFSWEEISRGMALGQNVILLYTLSPTAGLTADPWLDPPAEKAARAVLDAWVPKLKEKGWLDRTYFYGFDERGPDMFPAMKHVFDRFKRDYPVQTITTAYDSTYGIETGLTGAVDNFMPLLPRYDAQKAAAARARGTKVWWYVVTWNMEQHLVRSRLLPWMTYKVGADGFLIWCINRWRGEGAPKVKRAEWKTNTVPVKNEILNAWDPYLDGVCPNSSANYLYPGEDGPLSSTRLECFRDGIEDYDLLTAAAERLRALEKAGGPKEAIARLREAVSIEDAFIKNAIEASTSVGELKRRRERLVRALAATEKAAGRH